MVPVQKVGIITGANSGIGKELALQLSQKGVKVVMGCRNKIKAEAVASEIRTCNPEADLEVITLDLGSISSVREFASQVLSKYPQIHILINNAAETRLDVHRKTEDGFEIHFGTNYLAHFLLTQLLLERLRVSGGSAKVVNLTSACHSLANLDSDNGPNFTPSIAYARSKLAILLGTREIGRRVEGTGVIVIAVHPGVVDTEGFQAHIKDVNLGNWILDNVLPLMLRNSFMHRFLLSPRKSAANILSLLESTKTKNCAYYEINLLGTFHTKFKSSSGKTLWRSTLASLGLTDDDFYSNKVP